MSFYWPIQFASTASPTGLMTILPAGSTVLVPGGSIRQEPLHDSACRPPPEAFSLRQLLAGPLPPPLGDLGVVWDPFAPGLERAFDEAYARSVTPQSHEPLLIGYFLSNEPALSKSPRLYRHYLPPGVPRRHAWSRCSEHTMGTSESSTRPGAAI